MSLRVENLGAWYVINLYTEPQVSGLYQAFFTFSNPYASNDPIGIVPKSIQTSGPLGAWTLYDNGSTMGVYQGAPASLYGVGALEFNFTSFNNYDPRRATGFDFMSSFVRSGWNATPSCVSACLISSDVTTVEEVALVTEPTIWPILVVGFTGMAATARRRRHPNAG
jgi:hypothetical protein